MQIYACTRMLGKRTYYSFISNSLCSGGNAPMKSFMAWEYNMTKPTAYFEQNMVISQYQKHMGMGQNLLVSILMGWTSIYQLFCGSLGTRVMTHSHINIHEHCNFHPFSMAMLDYQRVDQNRSEWTLLVNECQWTMMKPCNSIVSAFQSPLRP